jgi:short-subunit dehydrogenase
LAGGSGVDRKYSSPPGILRRDNAGLVGDHAHLAADRYDVILIARDEKRLSRVKNELEGLHGIVVRVIVKDLSDPAAPPEVFDELQKESVHVDVLVNNAGFGLFGPFAEINLKRQLEMIQVNLTALTHLTKLFLGDMISSGGGNVLNVASTAAFQPGPLHSVYYATKAFVLSFSEAINTELEGTGVTVTAFCPGPTATEFFERAGATRSKRLRGLMLMDAVTAAEIGYRGMRAGKSLVIPGLWNRALTFMTRFMPRRLVTRVVRHMQEGVRAESE